MADASGLRVKIRNRAAASVRIAGNELVRTLRADTPRSQNPGVHTADRWTVTFSATSPTRFVATIANPAETDNGIPLVTILNDGSRAHPITPKRAKVLRFYSPSRSTRPDGYVFTPKVNHPGTTGTGFYDRTVNDNNWRTQLQIAWRTAA